MFNHISQIVARAFQALLTYSRQDLLNVLNFEFLQSGDLLGIMSVKEFCKMTI